MPTEEATATATATASAATPSPAPSCCGCFAFFGLGAAAGELPEESSASEVELRTKAIVKGEGVTSEIDTVAGKRESSGSERSVARRNSDGGKATEFVDVNLDDEASEELSTPTREEASRGAPWNRRKLLSSPRRKSGRAASTDLAPIEPSSPGTPGLVVVEADQLESKGATLSSANPKFESKTAKEDSRALGLSVSSDKAAAAAAESELASTTDLESTPQEKQGDSGSFTGEVEPDSPSTPAVEPTSALSDAPEGDARRTEATNDETTNKTQSSTEIVLPSPVSGADVPREELASIAVERPELSTHEESKIDADISCPGTLGKPEFTITNASETPSTPGEDDTMPPEDQGSVAEETKDDDLDPDARWLEIKDQRSGRMYYYNEVTKSSVWKKPKEFDRQIVRQALEERRKGEVDWVEAVDDLGRVYYYDQNTFAARWDRPASLSLPEVATHLKEEDALAVDTADDKSAKRSSRKEILSPTAVARSIGSRARSATSSWQHRVGHICGVDPDANT